MTVLQKRDARGFVAGPIRKFAVGAALAVVGVAAAFGLSQVIDQEATTALVTTPAERNAIAQGQAQRAESMQRVDQALIENYRQAATRSAAAVHAKTSAEWTLDDEIAAIKARVVSTSPAVAPTDTGSRTGFSEPRPE